MNNILLITMLLVDLLVILPTALIPYFTRKTELFGVSLPASQSDNPACKKLRAAYCSIMLALGAVLLLSTWLIMDDDVKTLLAAMGVMCGYLVVSFVLYLFMHNKMLALKATQKWQSPYDGVPAVVMATAEPRGGELVSPAWMLLYPLILLLTIMGIAIAWPYVPDPYPTHFNAAGIADAWSAKTIGSVSFLLILQAVMDVIFVGVYFIIKHAKRQIDAQNPEKSAAQLRVYRRTMSAMLTFLGVATALLMGAIQVFTIVPDYVSPGLVLAISIPAYLAVTVIACVIMYRVGQGGSRVKVSNAPAVSAKQVNINDDKHWLLGLFYYNRNDPAMFVEKRFGVGYTINLGKPIMLCAGILLILLVVGSLVWTFTLI
ncbi:membrane protein [Clostridia bacterium]|nr:membrane protein [Clostridia bacterium]